MNQFYIGNLKDAEYVFLSNGESVAYCAYSGGHNTNELIEHIKSFVASRGGYDKSLQEVIELSGNHKPIDFSSFNKKQALGIFL